MKTTSRSTGTSLIGKAVPRRDAYTKVTGQEKYAADYYSAHMLWAGVKRAGIVHGRLRGIDTERAKALPGVVAVLTSSDIPGSNRVGMIRKDQPVLVDSVIRHCGDPLALILAENRDALRQAIDEVSFDCEPLEPVFDAEEALKEGAPLVHADNPEGNRVREVSIVTGSGAEALEKCHLVIEAAFELSRQEHAYLETEAGWALMDDEGKLTVVASTQTPFRDRFEMAPVLNIDMERIRVVAPYLGGAFGGKDGITVQCLLGLAALHSGGRPVKMWWDREESFLASVKRLPVKAYYRLGAGAKGDLQALECMLYYDCGAYAGLSGEVMTLGLEHAGSAYRIPNVSITGRCVYTNNPPGGPFRGFGVPQATAAMEQMVDLLASRLGMDPLDVRELNAVQQGDRNCVGVTLNYSTGVRECLRRVSEHPLWQMRDEWKKAARGFKSRGMGIACMAHAMGYPPLVPDAANAKIELTAAGTIKVYAGITDMGQGNASTYLQITGEVLCQEPDTMELVLPDTDRTLPSGSSSASRTTYVYGNALIEAAKRLGGIILEKTRDYWGLPSSAALTLRPGGVGERDGGRELSFREIALLLEPGERVCTGYFKVPAAEDLVDLFYMGPHSIFSYGAHLACVEVDRLTGEVKVTDYLAATDAGKVLNPQVYAQQVEGGVVQGIGYALMEDFRVNLGKAETRDLSTYIIPTSLDVPKVLSIPVEIGEETGPFGLKGLGEITVSGALPAIANAIADACNVRTFRNPFTAETVLLALQHKEKGDIP